MSGPDGGGRLGRPFFARPTLEVARELLGQRLVRVEAGGRRLAGWIVETEAYVGSGDLGCHARAGRTARNASMWGPPGHAYVYFTYGLHWLLNIVTETDGVAGAVLLRALAPSEGLEVMRRRRGGRPDRQLSDGPAKLCQALALDGRHDGRDLCAGAAELFLEPGPAVPEAWVERGPRIGLNRVPEPWKSIPWRLYLDPRRVASLTASAR